MLHSTGKTNKKFFAIATYLLTLGFILNCNFDKSTRLETTIQKNSDTTKYESILLPASAQKTPQSASDQEFTNKLLNESKINLSNKVQQIQHTFSVQNINQETQQSQQTGRGRPTGRRRAGAGRNHIAHSTLELPPEEHPIFVQN